MKLRSLIAVMFALCALTTAASAQWRPIGDPGDYPYGVPGSSGGFALFNKNGRAYRISYVGTQGSPGDVPSSAPCDFNLHATGFAAQASVNGINLVPNGYLNGYLTPRVWLDNKLPFETGPIVTTDLGAASGTLRGVDILIDYRYGGPYASGTAMTNPVYKFKVTADNPYSNDFGIVVEVAQGGFNYSFGKLQPLMPGYPSSRRIEATSSGLFSSSIMISSPGSPGAMMTDGSLTMVRGGSVYQSVRLINGVGYFYTNTPLTLYSNLACMSADSMTTRSRFEIVPIRVAAGP